ncbi:hypothetical protein [Mesorhizobium sp. NZP2298]|uniref:hypothetical protein n=1 Tax=Mesorhizobium sp. NZP2298 TaxID=2483403 RepID=UPI0015539120|nr:hypothetical protein [Mesorhizobium sp. NZP2298]QKC97124.1 hypothetical protein EB231_22405 [Mesorhizobium sp. NZP2298]
MNNGLTNVERLVNAGVLDDTDLTTEGREAINAVPDLSDEEIEGLASVKEKLGLDKLDLQGRSVGIWRL